ncbi:MAG: ABC transporter ATP-binding protein, partial [Clostridiales bacterium]|nr:ABC transporter ATP-binding protein [Clostridiales bacterium]
MFQVKWLWQNMKGYRAMYVTGLILTVVCNILVLANPIIGQQIVDIFIKNDNAIQNLQEKRNLLILLCVGMVAFTLFRTLLQYGTNLCYEKSSQGLIFSLRTQLYDNIQNQDMKYYDSSRTGDLMTRMTGDLDMIRHSTAWIVKTML